MNKFFISSAVALALTSTHLAAGPIHTQGDMARFGTSFGEQTWLAKDNNGNGHGNDKARKNGHGNAGNSNRGNGKPEHAGGPKLKTNGKGVEHASHGDGRGASGRRGFTAAEREEVFGRMVSIPTPAGRDMKRVLGATALALATPQLLLSDIPEDELITYRNCPPGLAKKDPPCVPPGLARKGVTYDEWVSYDQDEYDTIWVERRDEWLRSQADVDPDPELLLLQSDQIATLFDLDPAADGQRYALIDGLPVLLDQKDYTSLLLVNQMAQVPDLVAGAPIAPTAALTQDELINLYRLPQLGDNENYAVVNGQVVRLNDSNYELLQMIRIARAVL
ncbi:hypothetical protein [Paracoccus benzoatiresistens]|uniref:Uncharacterized protein n=1 Tax=Paracoccus benzoatiresistens TaxID=2997341 RepID=A0ABT4JBJ5_9RHOB|nr:hypothetical protein [Paracoccus sp. EF6]MCZ0964269.1 hypothetical protein [Paracoccus sp. EF6]